MSIGYHLDGTIRLPRWTFMSRYLVTTPIVLKPSDTAKARARQTYRESPTTENIELEYIIYCYIYAEPTTTTLIEEIVVSQRERLLER